jgi:predicted transcriptional regulator
MNEPKRRYGRGEARLFKGISVRTDDDLDRRLDAIALRLARPGEVITRATAARMALHHGLTELEKQYPTT